MSIIAVRGFAPHTILKKAIKPVARVVKSKFEAFNFVRIGPKNKTCYYKISGKLNPTRVVKEINADDFAQRRHLRAYIPETVPEIRGGKKKKVYDEDPPAMVFELTHKELLIELQAKYSELYNLSSKMGHQLLEQLSMEIFDRLKKLYLRGGAPMESAFFFSSYYRRSHPHFSDFHTVMSTLHAIEDASGQPRTPMMEVDLMTSDIDIYTATDNFTYPELSTAGKKYAKEVSRRLREHLDALPKEMSSSDTEEMMKRKKIRRELQRMSPQFSMMIKQVIKKHLLPDKAPPRPMRMYGEPSLPGRELTAPVLGRHGVVQVTRSNHMYNLIEFNVHPRHYASVKAMDGTVMGEAKLTVQSADIPLYDGTSQLRSEISALFRDGGPMEEQPEFLVY